MAERVRFDARDGGSIGEMGPYDLAIVIESIHDLSRPVEVLEGIRQSLAPDGTLIVADEKVAETFIAPGDSVERLMYGFSFLICLPSGLSEQPSAATGTVMRPDTLRRLRHGGRIHERGDPRPDHPRLLALLPADSLE